jgi:hypothetical protein
VISFVNKTVLLHYLSVFTVKIVVYNGNDYSCIARDLGEMGGIPEVLKAGETGILPPPGDPRMPAGTPAAITDNTEKMRCMGRSGRERYELLLKEKLFVEKSLDIYREALRQAKTAWFRQSYRFFPRWEHWRVGIRINDKGTETEPY